MARTPDRTSGRSEQFDLSTPNPSDGSVRWAEILIGLVVVVTFIGAGVWLFVSATATTAVLAVRDGVERGEVLERDNLYVLEISAQQAMAYMTVDEVEFVVGQQAVADLRPGTVVTPDLFTTGAVLVEMEGIVGASLVPGQYPRPSLQVGDWVRVLRTIEPFDDSVVDAQLIAPYAQVAEINEVVGESQLFFSLRMSIPEADKTANAEAENKVALVHVAAPSEEE